MDTEIDAATCVPVAGKTKTTAPWRAWREAALLAAVPYFGRQTRTAAVVGSAVAFAVAVLDADAAVADENMPVAIAVADDAVFPVR